MQTFLFYLGLFSHLTTLTLAVPIGLPIGNSALGSFENDILAGGTSNNTLQIVTDTSSVLNASNYLIDVQCVSSTRYSRIVVDDYYEAVDQILTRNDAMTPVHWLVGPGRSLVWQSGRCSIGLTARTQIRTQPLPIILAAHMAALVAKKCLTEAEGYRGGAARLIIPGQPLVFMKAMGSSIGGDVIVTA